MTIEKEYFNQILPLGNTPGTRSIVQVPANPTGGVLNMDTAFGPTGGLGHFVELKAMASGTRIDVAFSNSPTYGIEFGNMGGTGGNYTGVAWPLLHGETIRGRIPVVGIGSTSPTLPGYPLSGYRPTFAPAQYLHYRTPLGTPTGSVLHIRQSSLIPGQKAGEPGGFPAPY